MERSSSLLQVHSLLQERALPQAEALCRTLLAAAPADADALHLLGLIRKEAGDGAEGERLLRASIARAPRCASFHANLANLLRRQRRLAEAEQSYAAALALEPSHAPARLGLARTLNDRGDHAGAEAHCRALVSANRADPQAWSALAMALRDQHRYGEAEAAYRAALEVAPRDPLPAYNLGALLLQVQRADEALAQLERARSLGLGGPELAFNRGRALLELYRIDEAEQAFAAAVALAPRDLPAQLALVRLRFMRADPRFARSLASAAAEHPGDVALRMAFADVLRRAGDLHGAEVLLRDLLARVGSTPELRSALSTVLQESGRLREAELEALEAVAARPADVRMVENLVAIQLGLGRAREALAFIARQRTLTPQEQGWIAYEATAARLLGDPLYEELYDYSRYVRTYDLVPPAGWGSIRELNEALLEHLTSRHRFAMHPLDQSLRQGSQTAHNLLVDPHPAVRAVLGAFQEPLEAYRAAIGTHARHPLSSRSHGRPRIREAWSVQLRREGYHVNHIHPEGWISSAYYVSVPAEVADDTLMAGWIKFGEPRHPVPGATAGRVVQPVAGRLVLFPSYMWHGTNAIHGSELRTTIAFDATPEGERR
jgi:tetratricopeptide (TPR) repeat protein